jgi:carboxypeptidase family protein
MALKLKGFAVCLLILASTAFAYGQGAVGTILGTVTDSSGAVVAGADVQVTNLATNVSHSTKTTDTGDFTAPYLPPGNYRVSVQAQGFQKTVVDNVNLVVAQQARVDVAMKTGVNTEVVEVQGSAVALDTDSSAVSQIITQKQVDQLPLNGRNFLSLLFIGAGAVETRGAQSFPPIDLQMDRLILSDTQRNCEKTNDQHERSL